MAHEEAMDKFTRSHSPYLTVRAAPTEPRIPVVIELPLKMAEELLKLLQQQVTTDSMKTAGTPIGLDVLRDALDQTLHGLAPAQMVETTIVRE